MIMRPKGRTRSSLGDIQQFRELMTFGSEMVHQDEENVQPNLQQHTEINNNDITSDTMSVICHQTTDVTTNNQQLEAPFKPKAFVPDFDEENVYQSRPILNKN